MTSILARQQTTDYEMVEAISRALEEPDDWIVVSGALSTSLRLRHKSLLLEISEDGVVLYRRDTSCAFEYKFSFEDTSLQKKMRVIANAYNKGRVNEARGNVITALVSRRHAPEPDQ